MLNILQTIWNILTIVSTLAILPVIVKGISLWLKGILPILLRLGKGLAESEIAIFAKSDHYSTLENLLLDSGLFPPQKILKISSNGDIGRAQKASLYLVFWHDWYDEDNNINDIDHILSQKRDKIPLIIYAPQALGFIPKNKMVQLNQQRNTTVTNFRGRLLNDIMISLITGSYSK